MANDLYLHLRTGPRIELDVTKKIFNLKIEKKYYYCILKKRILRNGM